MSTDGPGFHHQSGTRTTFRAVGAVVVAGALVLVGVALVDFFSAMVSQESDARPERIWMFFLGVPLFLAGAFCLAAGFGKAGRRHPVDGTLEVPEHAWSQPASGTSCPRCGASANSGARFCGSCGQPFAPA